MSPSETASSDRRTDNEWEYAVVTDDNDNNNRQELSSTPEEEEEVLPELHFWMNDQSVVLTNANSPPPAPLPPPPVHRNNNKKPSHRGAHRRVISDIITGMTLKGLNEEDDNSNDNNGQRGGFDFSQVIVDDNDSNLVQIHMVPVKEATTSATATAPVRVPRRSHLNVRSYPPDDEPTPLRENTLYEYLDLNRNCHSTGPQEQQGSSSNRSDLLLGELLPSRGNNSNSSNNGAARKKRGHRRVVSENNALDLFGSNYTSRGTTNILRQLIVDDLPSKKPRGNSNNSNGFVPMVSPQNTPQGPHPIQQSSVGSQAPATLWSQNSVLSKGLCTGPQMQQQMQQQQQQQMQQQQPQQQVGQELGFQANLGGATMPCNVQMQMQQQQQQKVGPGLGFQANLSMGTIPCNVQMIANLQSSLAERHNSTAQQQQQVVEPPMTPFSNNNTPTTGYYNASCGMGQAGAGAGIMSQQQPQQQSMQATPDVTLQNEMSLQNSLALAMSTSAAAAVDASQVIWDQPIHTTMDADDNSLEALLFNEDLQLLEPSPIREW